MSDVRNRFEDEDDSFTTVLSEGYTDYHETVVDEAGSFDPSLFSQSPTTEPASQAQPNTRQQAASQNEDDFATRTLGTPPPGARGYQHDASSARQYGQAGVQSGGQASAGYAQNTARASQNGWQQTQSYGANAPWQQGSHGSTSRWRPANWRASHLGPNMMAATDKSSSSSNTVLIVVLVVLGVIAIVAIVVALVLALAPRNAGQVTKGVSPAVVAPATTSSSSSSYKNDEAARVGAPLEGEQSESASSTSASTESTSGGVRTNGNSSPNVVGPGNGKAVSEAEFYEALAGYYKDAADYDKSVASCANDFNNNYQKEDESIRKSKAAAAKSLKQRIKSSWDAVKNLKMPFMSKNVDAFNDIVELYECLWHRIDCIDQAWQICLKYDKPAKHKDEILVPIMSDQVNGENKYYTRFNELYSQVKLIKP